jgi:chromosome segregation ATPase
MELEGKLKNNLWHLRTRVNENALLQHVISDYEGIYSKLNTQKQNHQVQINKISAHLKHIRETNYLTETGLQHVTHEQNKLLSKLQHLKESIENIIDT